MHYARTNFVQRSTKLSGRVRIALCEAPMMVTNQALAVLDGL